MRTLVRVLGLLPFLATSAVHAQTPQILELPRLPAPDGYSTALQVVDMNEAGEIVGNVTFSRRPCPSCPATYVRRAWIVSNGAATQVGPDSFQIVAINDAGDILGNLRNPADALLYPYLVHDGVLTPLSTTAATAVDLNDAGDVSYGPRINDWGVFGAMQSDGEHGLRAFKYSGTFPTNDLNCSMPSPLYECVTGYSTGFDFVANLNDGTTVQDAMLVGGDRDNPWSSSYGRQHAYVGYQGQTTYLSAGFTAASLAVNDTGLIVGYDDGKAIVWTRTGPHTWREDRVNDLIGDATWNCTTATAVNNSNWVAGSGTHSGNAAAFLLLPAVIEGGPRPHGAPGGQVRNATAL